VVITLVSSGFSVNIVRGEHTSVVLNLIDYCTERLAREMT
jgi:hypothetical protein